MSRSTEHGRGRRQRGFSLLEVLVAFSILAISLGVLMQIFSQGTRNVAISAHYAKALTLAESRLAAAGHEVPLGESATGSELDGEYDWQLVSEPLEPADAGPSALSLYRVSVVVQWGPQSQRRSVDLETIKVQAR